MYSTESAWSAKLISITDAGCPSAADRLISRPSPSRLILRPSFNEYSSTKVRVVRFDDDIFSRAGISISTLKCPELEMIAPSFIRSKCSLVSTLLLPVTVQNTSPSLAAPAVARYHELRTGQKKIRGADNAVEGGLSSAVAVVEQVLGVGVVNGDDGELEHAVLGHSAQADDAG